MDIDRYIISRAKQMVAKQRKGGMVQTMGMMGDVEGGSKFGRFLKNLGRDIKKVGKKVAPALAGVATTIVGQPELAPLAMRATKAIVGKGRKQSDKMKRRGELVRMLMREQGMSLPQASHYIKVNNLMV